MKKFILAFLAICVLAALIEGIKPGGSNSQSTRNNRPSTNSTQTYPNQPSRQYSNPNPVTYTCPMCSGAGKITCRVCGGSGENSIYEHLSPVQRGFSSPRCEGCNGNGWITCGRCHGTGRD